jgi:hypothetical protein
MGAVAISRKGKTGSVRQRLGPASKALREAVRRDRREAEEARKMSFPLGGTHIVGGKK